MSDEEEGAQGWSHDLRSYGRRRGRKLSPRQERLMREVLPRVCIDLSLPAPSSTHALLRAPDAGRHPKAQEAAPDASRHRKAQEAWLEIGFGGGEHLLWQARNNPAVLLLGSEPFEDGVVKVLTSIEEEGIGNIRLHADDVRGLVRRLPVASLSRVFILFPDPWPKRRHAKRRLINSDLLAELVRVMHPGAELRIATDIGDYARTILMAAQKTPALVWTARSAEDWRHQPDDWPRTRYQAKADREGRRSAFLTFVRRQD